MSFLYPIFLFALFTLAIPLIIHLYSFKRFRTVYFSNVRLLKRIRQESGKRDQLKRLFILIARILAIISLVFAFSRPYIPGTNGLSNADRQLVGIYIDNSFSMMNSGEKGQLLEQAKLKAAEIADSYPAGTQFFIQTNDFLPEHQLALSKEQFIRQVAEIRESSRSLQLAEVYMQATGVATQSGDKARKTFYILSDFQRNSMDFGATEPDSMIWTYLLPLSSGKTNNLLIDSCWFEVPGRKIGQPEKLFVSVRNMSDQSYRNIPVRLTINDSLKAISNVNIDELGQSTIELNYTNNSKGIQLCKVELDDYPIIYDNSYFMSYQVRGKLSALGIANPSQNGSDYLKKLFAGDELISYDEWPENGIQISQLKNYQCIFLVNNQKISSGLRSELSSFVEQGGTLVIFPGQVSDYNDYNALLNAVSGTVISGYDTLKTGISEVNYSHELYRNVFKNKAIEADLPAVTGSVSFVSRVKNTETPLLKFRNGKNALGTHSFGEGTVYTFAFPLSPKNLDFIRHIIFVPTVYNMVLNSGESQRYSYSIGSDEPVLLRPNQTAGEITIVNSLTRDEFLTSSREAGSGKRQLAVEQLPLEAGHYLVKSGNQVLQPVSYNFPRKESVPEFYSEEDLKKLIQADKFKQFGLIRASEQNFSETLQDLNNGEQLWKYFIALAILFLFFEMAIIHLWK